MPSKMHQMLIGLIGRKMYEKGYLPVAFDGKNYVLHGEHVHVPPRIGRHRPDIIGIDLKTKVLCIGEAKTASDLSSERTREQFSDYANIMGVTSKQRFDLMIGIPKSAEKALLKLMKSLKLNDFPNVSYIVLPDELVEND